MNMLLASNLFKLTQGLNAKNIIKIFFKKKKEKKNIVLKLCQLT